MSCHPWERTDAAGVPAAPCIFAPSRACRPSCPPAAMRGGEGGRWQSPPSESVNYGPCHHRNGCGQWPGHEAVENLGGPANPPCQEHVGHASFPPWLRGSISFSSYDAWRGWLVSVAAAFATPCRAHRTSDAVTMVNGTGYCEVRNWRSIARWLERWTNRMYSPGRGLSELRLVVQAGHKKGVAGASDPKKREEGEDSSASACGPAG